MLAPAGGPHRILTVAAHAPGEAVASPARVLGDGSVKFKYLSPNTLLAVVGLPRGAAELGSDAAEGGRLTALALDAVTGRVLFSQAHEVGGRAGWAGEAGSARVGACKRMHRPSRSSPYAPRVPSRHPLAARPGLPGLPLTPSLLPRRAPRGRCTRC